MINYILQNNLQDTPYLMERSIAAYLVRDDDGMLARDINGNHIVFDNDANSFMAVAGKGGELPSMNMDPEGHFQWEGIAVTPVFQLLKDQFAPYTLEKTAEATGLSIETIVNLTEQYAKCETAFICSGYGLRYHNTNETYRMQHLLGIITGRFRAPLRTSGGTTGLPLVTLEIPG